MRIASVPVFWNKFGFILSTFVLALERFEAKTVGMFRVALVE